MAIVIEANKKLAKFFKNNFWGRRNKRQRLVECMKTPSFDNMLSIKSGIMYKDHGQSQGGEGLRVGSGVGWVEEGGGGEIETTVHEQQ